MPDKSPEADPDPVAVDRREEASVAPDEASLAASAEVPAESDDAAGEPAGDQNHFGTPYVAVVYFHGMGSQRRFEETSRLVEALDEVSNNGQRALYDITCHVEPSNVKAGEVVQYIRTVHSKSGGNQSNGSGAPRTGRLVHFYEGYWAPLTAREVGAATVLWWLFKQAARPYQMLFGSRAARVSSPQSDTRTTQGSGLNRVSAALSSTWRSVLPNWDWRGHARLRRAALRELEARHKSLEQQAGVSMPVGVPQPEYQATVAAASVRMQPGDMRFLLRAYHRFERPDIRRKFPTGTYAEFRAFLAAELERLRAGDSAVTRVPLIADAWMRYMVVSELRNAAVLTSMVLAIVLAILGSLQLTSAVLGIVSIKSWLGVDWNAATIAGSLATVFGLVPFLSRYMGDVVFWSTYEETDRRFKKRKEILCYGVKVLKHVLKDKNCQRVVVVAHSLGTAVAHDVLLELGKEEWARHHGPRRFKSHGVKLVKTDEINKIEHFVTAGSPIDKIHYFFESDPGRSHRYTRVAETIRGDMGRKPFGNNNNTPYLHWINFWDKADIISGSLESPPNSTDTEVCVDNVEVSNGTWNPGSAHTSYFTNRVVLKYLLEIIYQNKYSYWAIGEPNRPSIRSRPDYLAQNIGVGSGSSAVRWVQAAALTLPWIILVIVLWHFLARSALS